MSAAAAEADNRVVVASVPRLKQALAPLELDRLLNSLASLRGCVTARFFALLRCAVSFVPLCRVLWALSWRVSWARGTWARTNPTSTMARAHCARGRSMPP